MKTMIATLAALFLAAPTLQAKGLEDIKIDLPAKLEIPRFALTGQNDMRRMRAVQTALTAMKDGNEIGTQVAGYVLKNKVRVVFTDLDAPSALAEGDDSPPVIYLDNELPLYPRILAVYIAREASELMLGTMVDSAEKSYMCLSQTLRTWLELGGSPKDLPVIEPLNKYADKDLAKTFKTWLKDPGSEKTLHEVGKEAKTETIFALEAKVYEEIMKYPEEHEFIGMFEKLLEGLERDNKRFVDFILDEHEWRQANAFRLK